MNAASSSLNASWRRGIAQRCELASASGRKMTAVAIQISDLDETAAEFLRTADECGDRCDRVTRRRLR